jgi:predicted RNase H-like nuclease (RuvC/YqgF family)
MTEDKDSICCSWYESCTYYMQCEHLYNENKDLSEDVYRLEQENKELKSALEEIRAILNKECGVISNAKAVGLINEVLGDECN